MAKLYIFGIGGTGSRVIKSLTNLLATGVELGSGIDTIVPIIIDPDNSNGNLTETKQVLDLYVNLNKELDNKNFFKTNIEKLFQNYVLTIEDTNLKFGNFIGYNQMNESMKAFISSMFSKNTLESDMSIGFKGNPNMGSIVLNQFNHSEQFVSFANDFSQGDKIFIISSIFGGTGASGFPLLLKSLRGNNNIPNFALINQANIGALSMLPYFNLKSDDESEINSETFISKTKAALHYYENNVTKSNGVNSMYYLADTEQENYENNSGSVKQRNKAHFIEMIGALSIVDFTFKNDSGNCQVYEFGLENDTSSITFNDFDNITNSRIKTNIIRYKFLIDYLKNEFTKNNIGNIAWAVNNKIKSEIFTTPFMNSLNEFNTKFENWLNEMKDNKRSLQLFIEPHDKDVFNSINKIDQTRSFNPLSAKSYNFISKKILDVKLQDSKTNDLIMGCLYNGIGKAIQEKYNLN